MAGRLAPSRRRDLTHICYTVHEGALETGIRSFIQHGLPLFLAHRLQFPICMGQKRCCRRVFVQLVLRRLEHFQAVSYGN
jgi:hypothetical protein